VDANGSLRVDAVVADGTVTILDRASRVAVYVVATKAGERARIEARRQTLIAGENAIDFDPGSKPEDVAVLRALIQQKAK
jgi:hypothetical protein